MSPQSSTGNHRIVDSAFCWQEGKPNPPNKPAVSDRKVQANRANARKSTGPKTAEGKLWSSRNAIKHGILVRGPDMENREELVSLLRGVRESLHPEGSMEETCVEEIAGCLWRFRRAHRA